MTEKKSCLEVVAGRDIAATDDHYSVIEMVADVLDRLIDGDLQEVDRVVITLVAHDGPRFRQSVAYHASPLEAMGYLRVAETAVLDEIVGR